MQEEAKRLEEMRKEGKLENEDNYEDSIHPVKWEEENMDVQ